MNQIEISIVPAALLAHIRIDLVRRYALDSAPTVTAVWQIVNPYSLVFCVALAHGAWRRRVYAKVPRNPHPGHPLGPLMHHEFDVLRDLSLNDALNTAAPEAASVEALGYYGDIPALVTMEASGNTLRKDYSLFARRLALTTARQQLLHRVRLCGEWLKWFHTHTANGECSFNSDELIDYCKIRLDRLDQRYPAVMDGLKASHLLDVTKAKALSIPAGALRLSSRHNDFASHNIISTMNNGVCMIDFTMCDYGVNAYDVCNFWLELELLKCDPTYSAPFLEELQAVFLQAYGMQDLHAPDFELARMQYTVTKLLNTAERLTRFSRWTSPHAYRSAKGLQGWLATYSAG